MKVSLLPIAGCAPHFTASRVRPASARKPQACFWRRVCVCLLVFGGFAPVSARAAVLATQFTDLTDTVPGMDRWEARYALSAVSFAAGQGFTLYFAHDHYRDLALVTPPDHPGWDLLVVQPDVGLPDAGFFDGLALVDNPPLVPPFVVTFVWLGGGTGGPGQHPFELYDTTGGFRIIGEGTTVPIPEPGGMALVLGGVLLAGAGLRRWAVRRNRASLPTRDAGVGRSGDLVYRGMPDDHGRRAQSKAL
ncbi:MAG: hypothetical protein HS113_10590 [Verrucomicrobiales bacterium]|nr:hypothetical protein [Verrucomicrobiales bacterium]